MKRKNLIYAAVPLAAMVLMGIGTASAHGFGFGMSNLTPDQVAERQTNMFTQEASILGVSVDEVKNAWAKGETIAELAKQKGITEDQLKTKMEAVRKQQTQDHLKTLVAKGVITQAQADARLKFMETRIQKFNDGTNQKGFGRGHGGGFGPGMGMMGL